MASGQAFSAVIVDGGLPAVDRDLVDRAREVGAAVIVVDDGRRRVDWAGMGVDAVLADPFDRADLLSVLLGCAPAIEGPAGDAGRAQPRHPRRVGEAGWWRSPGPAARAPRRWPWPWPRASARRRAIRVWSCWPTWPCTPIRACSTTPATSCPGSRSWSRPTGSTCPAVDQVRAHVFDTGDRGYDLLLGLRRHRDWPVLRPRAVQACLDGLLRSYRLVVADLDPDLEGDDEVGSLDVEERNVLARTAAGRADLVLVVAPPTVVGLRRLVLILDEWHRGGRRRRAAAGGHHPGASPGHGPSRDHRGRRRPGRRACAPSWPRRWARPLFVGERRGIDQLPPRRHGAARRLVRPLTDAVEAVLERARPRRVDRRPAAGLTPITPGSLGAWADDEALG